MCTSIALNTPAFFFGRNLDLEYTFGQRVTVTPRNYPFLFRNGERLDRHFALIGMATVMEGYPLYAEAANEKGLCMAGLNFPGNAYYWPEPAAGKTCLSSFELIPWLLGRCETVAQARELLQGIQVMDTAFSPQTPPSPLHWHIADRNGSLVAEAMRDGLHLYDNPVGVMTNNPPFDFHLTNLRQYLNVTPEYGVNRFSESLSLTPFGNGLGGVGLPGDASPASRFVRAAFLRANSVCGPDEDSGVAQFFHLLDSVAMTCGSVRTRDGRQEITDYSCCYSQESQTYYYKTYKNNQLTAVCLAREPLEADALREFPLRDAQSICLEN